MHALKNLDKKTLLQIAAVAWPMAMNAILMQSITIVDLLLVASLGDIAVAAFGIGGAISAFVLSIQQAIGQGTQLVLSRAIGAGDTRKIGLEVANGWLLNVVFSVSAVIVLLLGAQPMIAFIAHDQAVAEQAYIYVLVSLLIICISSVCNVASSYFNASRKTQIPLYGFIVEIPINIVCSAALIHGLWGAPKLGLAGAAWGSVLAIAFRFFYLAYRFNQERLQGYISGLVQAGRASLIAHFHEVFPVAANFIVLFTGLLAFQGLFAQLPVPEYAAITLIMPWIKIGSMFVNSWTQSSTILVSQKLGKALYQEVKPLVLQSKFISVVMMLIMVLGFYLFSVAIPFIYPKLSAETIAALAIIAPAYVLIPLFRVNNMFCGNMIRALGESYLIVRINIITQWLIAIPLCAVLVYLNAPLLLVFGVILFDEILKYYPFRKTLFRLLDHCDSRK